MTAPHGPPEKSEDDEQAAIAHIVESLAIRHPGIPVETITELANAAYAKYRGAPIRDFVPVMVEREVKQEVQNQLEKHTNADSDPGRT